MTIGERLKERRVAEGLTQRELAQRAGVSERSLRYVEDESRIGESMSRVAHALKMRVMIVLEDADYCRRDGLPSQP